MRKVRLLQHREPGWEDLNSTMAALFFLMRSVSCHLLSSQSCCGYYSKVSSNVWVGKRQFELMCASLQQPTGISTPRWPQGDSEVIFFTDSMFSLSPSRHCVTAKKILTCW